MISRKKNLTNKEKKPTEWAVYLNKAEARSLWTDDGYRDRLIRLCMTRIDAIRE